MIWYFGDIRVGIFDLAQSLVHLVRPLLLKVDCDQRTSTLSTLCYTCLRDVMDGC